MLDVTTAAPVETAAEPTWTGFVRFLHITPRAFLPMRAMPEITLVAGRGIEGDRYMIGREEGFIRTSRRWGVRSRCSSWKP